jgi:hypothetical protein
MLKRTIIILLSLAAIVYLYTATAQAQASVAPLSLQQAKTAAKNRGWSFPTPGGVESVKVSWTNRWSAWQIDIGVDADGTTTERDWDSCKTFSSYSFNCIGGWDYYTLPSFAIATVDVFKSSRTGRITTRVEDDMSTSGDS